MLIAVIYTGASRTIETTIQHFKKNVLLNDNYHVFGVIQSDDHESLIRTVIGDNLKSLEWFDKENMEWINLREELLSTMNMPDKWKHYLRSSGSMIEYYQLYIAYQALERYEKEHNMRYDFVLRFRTDTVLKDVIDFDKIMTPEYIKDIIYKIKDELKTEINEQVVQVFMNTFYNENRIHYKNIEGQFLPIHLLELRDDEIIDKLIDYVTHGNYVVSLRKNVIYFMRRDVMTKIHQLGMTYGQYTDDSNEYWFNSESQLDNICAKYNIDKYSSTTVLEDSSLYLYNPMRYYENDELKGEYSFFIKRY